MRRVLALVLAACSGPAGSPPDRNASPATAPPLAVSDPAPPLAFGAPVAAPAEPTRPLQLWNARHGLPIAAVFPVEDGRAAVTLDEASHARLWPTLDGTREPYVLPLALPNTAAVVRVGDGFAIAALDSAGGLEVIAVSAVGVLTADARHAPEPGFEALVATAAGFIALRRDQQLELFDTHGDRRGTLAALPGEHVVKLLHRRGRTLALVRTREGLRARWLATGPLAWGTQTPKLALDPDRVFLSPDHEHLLWLASAPAHVDLLALPSPSSDVMVADLATGKSRRLATATNGVPPDGRPIGIAGDGKLVLAFDDFELGALTWWTLAGFERAELGGDNGALEAAAMSSAVVTDAGVLVGAGRELAIATPNTAREPSKVSFLGYRIERASALRSSPRGAVAAIGGAAWLLDERARARDRLPGSDALPIGEHLGLARVLPRERPTPPRPTRIEIDLDADLPLPRHRPRSHLALVDLDTGRELQRWRDARAFHYEPQTQLLALDRGTNVELAKLDLDRRRFGESHVVPGPVTQVALLDPALAGGATALLVREHAGTLEVRRVRGVEPEPARTIAGSLAAIDRAGRLYVRDGDAIVIERDDNAPVRIPDLAGWNLVPSPTGELIAAFARDRLALFERSGARRWAIGLPRVSGAAWTPDGGLVVLARDLTAVDVATGEILAAQCGWSFALRSGGPSLDDAGAGSDTLCDR